MAPSMLDKEAAKETAGASALSNVLERAEVPTHSHVTTADASERPQKDENAGDAHRREGAARGGSFVRRRGVGGSVGTAFL